jgi:hypothetical protein
MDNVALKIIDEFKELCKPEHLDDTGNTALIWACENEMDNVALKLIDEFKELCKPEQLDDTALIRACHNKLELRIKRVRKTVPRR